MGSPGFNEKLKTILRNNLFLINEDFDSEFDHRIRMHIIIYILYAVNITFKM